MATDPFAPLVADRTALNTVKWAARDYASIFDDLLRRLKAVYAEVYNDYATTTQGIMLVEMMAYATGQLQWYLDRIASDCFLETARTPEAVGRLVKQLGYKMRPAAAASVDLTLTFPDGTPGPCTLPARWRFQGPNGLVYESYAALTEPVALAAGATRTVSAYQGESRILTFTGNGTANQSYNLSSVPTGKYVAQYSVECWVDGLEWAERDFLTCAADEQFEVDYSADPPVVRFGDGVAGLMPDRGAEVKVRFVVIDGAKGNEPKAHAITASIDTLIVGGTTVTIDVDNMLAPVGGADPETTDHAVRLAPMSFAARGAAITAQDYDALSNSYSDPLYGAVAKAFAYNPRGTYTDLTFNNLIEQVEVYLTAYVATVAALEADVVAAGAALTPDLAVITAAMADLEALRGELDGWVLGAKGAVQAARANCTTADAALTAINATAVSLATTLIDLYDYADDNTTGTVRTDLLAFIATAQAYQATVATQGAVAQGAVQTAGTGLDNAVSAQLNPALDAIENAAPTAPDTSLPAIEAEVAAEVAALTTGLTTLATETATIQGTAAALEASIVGETASMRARIATLFSDDCLSNYVQVPILALDADGNYVAPSIGLIVGLQTYLDGVKEVTQQVDVVDGSSALCQASLSVDLLTGPAYVYEEEEAKVQQAFITLLKGRDFDQPLYLSDLYKAAGAASTGIVYINIRITGPVADRDADGNLVPDPNRIIVLASGGLTFTKLTA